MAREVRPPGEAREEARAAEGPRSAGRRPRRRPRRGARRGPGRGPGAGLGAAPEAAPEEVLGGGRHSGVDQGAEEVSPRPQRPPPAQREAPREPPTHHPRRRPPPRDAIVVVRPRGRLILLGFTRRGTTRGIERGVIVHRVLRSSLAQPRVHTRAGRNDLRSRASNPKRTEVLHLHHGGRGGRAARRIRLSLLLVPFDGFLELRHPLQLFVGREAHALMLLQPRQLRAERPDVSALEHIFSRLFALRLVLRDLFLPLLSAMRVARSQSLVALRGRREKGRVSLRRGACRVEETLRIADFVGRGKDVGASGKRTFPMANPRAGWKPYAYVTGLKPAAEDRRDTHRLARARGVSATFRTRVPSCETRLGRSCAHIGSRCRWEERSCSRSQIGPPPAHHPARLAQRTRVLSIAARRFPRSELASNVRDGRHHALG